MLSALNLTASDAEIAAAQLERVIDLGGAANALYLDGTDLVSETAFNDTFELRVGQYVITVTDENSYSSDLSQMLYSVTIYAEKDENGHYVIKPGKAYSAFMTFKEDQDGLQFAADGHLEYTFPNGFVPEDVSGTFTIIATSHGVDYPVEGNTYRVVNGELFVDLNTSSLNYPYVASSPITEIELEITGTFDTTVNWIKSLVRSTLFSPVALKRRKLLTSRKVSVCS